MKREKKFYVLPQDCYDPANGLLQLEIVNSAVAWAVRRAMIDLNIFSFESLVGEIMVRFHERQKKYADCPPEIVRYPQTWLCQYARGVVLNMRKKEAPSRHVTTDGAVLFDWKKGPEEVSIRNEEFQSLLQHPNAGLTSREHQVIAFLRSRPEESPNEESFQWGEATFGIKAENVRKLYWSVESKIRRLCESIRKKKCKEFEIQALQSRWDIDSVLDRIPKLLDERRDDRSHEIINYTIVNTLLEISMDRLMSDLTVDDRLTDIMTAFASHLDSPRFWKPTVYLLQCRYCEFVHLLREPNDCQQDIYNAYYLIGHFIARNFARGIEGFSLDDFALQTENTSQLYRSIGDYQLGRYLLDMGIWLLQHLKNEQGATRLEAIAKSCRAPLI